MKIKIIDLLNKIANGEEVPDKIIYDNVLYKFYGCAYRDDDNNTLGQNTILDLILDKEVEIIEEYNKIEKLDLQQVDLQQSGTTSKFISLKDYKIQEKINEIIDRLNEGE